MGPNVIPVPSFNDPRLTPYRQLKERKLAEEAGLFIAEGEHLVRRMLAPASAARGIEPVSLLVSDHRVETILPAVPPGVPVYVMPETRISEVIGYKFHLGMLGCGRRPGMHRLDDLLPFRTLVACPHLQNLDNLGLIVRTAAALGIDGLLLGQRGAHPFMRRVVRVSMGSVFTLPIVQSDDIHRDLLTLRDEHVAHLVATVLDPQAIPLDDYRPGPNDRVVVLLGNEPEGLDRRTTALATHKVTIPMSRGVDSLNVAVAAGIVLHHVMRRA